MKSGSLQRLVATSLWLAVGLATAAPASVSAERFAEATLVEPPAWLNMTPETESWIAFAGTATTPGFVAHYRNGTLDYNQSYSSGSLGGHVIDRRDSHRFEFWGSPLRLLVANQTLTRQWWRTTPHLDVVLYSPQAIVITPSDDLWFASGRTISLEHDEIRLRVTTAEGFTATIYSESLVPLGSGAAISAERQWNYYVSFNASTWPARLVADVILEPVATGDFPLGIVLLTAVVAPILLVSGLLWRRRRESSPPPTRQGPVRRPWRRARTR